VKSLFFAALECPGTFDSEMDFSVAYTAHGDEICFHIASQQAARLNVMDLEVFGTPAS